MSILLIAIPEVENFYFRIIVRKIEAGRPSTAQVSWEVSTGVHRFFKTPWSLRGKKRLKFNRKLTLAGYSLLFVYALTLLVS